MTIVLIEDYALLRVALQHILESVRGISSIRAFSGRHLDAEPPIAGQLVDLMVLGATGTGDHDLGVLSQSISLYAPRLVLMLYVAVDPAVMAAAARMGVAGYLPKASTPEALAAAVSLVLAGGQCYPRPAAAPLPRTQDPGRPARGLTRRQEDILRLLVQGKTMREISAQVGISVATVKSHARTLYWKLNARNQAEAAYIAVQMGLVPSAAPNGKEPL